MARVIFLMVSLRRTTSRRFPIALQINGALRYSVASYESRASNAPLGPDGVPLFPDDSQRFRRLSGRIGAVVRVYGGFDIAGKYTRGFRAPNTTDLGIIGLVGTGFEVDTATRPPVAAVLSAQRQAEMLFQRAFQSRLLNQNTATALT